MSRVNDLIYLIQTTNQIYLIDPKHHTRSAFIQIDDLCELTMKSWLQNDTLLRQRLKWTHLSRQEERQF
jgi:hypothetical protein